MFSIFVTNLYWNKLSIDKFTMAFYTQYETERYMLKFKAKPITVEEIMPVLEGADWGSWTFISLHNFLIHHHACYALSILSLILFLDILDRTNLAPLHTATNNDNVAVVSALVAAGANPNLHGIGGATPLHIGVCTVMLDIIESNIF